MDKQYQSGLEHMSKVKDLSNSKEDKMIKEEATTEQMANLNKSLGLYESNNKSRQNTYLHV